MLHICSLRDQFDSFTKNEVALQFRTATSIPTHCSVANVTLVRLPRVPSIGAIMHHARAASSNRISDEEMAMGMRMRRMVIAV